MKQISNKEYERYQQYQTDKLYGRISVQQRSDQPVGLQAAGGHESEREQPLGEESSNNPMAENRKAVRHAVYQPERGWPIWTNANG